jgi:hypothetical protein
MESGRRLTTRHEVELEARLEVRIQNQIEWSELPGAPMQQLRVTVKLSPPPGALGNLGPSRLGFLQAQPGLRPYPGEH